MHLTELDPATGKPTQGIVGDRNARFLGGISANTGVFSDLEDMVVFMKMLACGGAGYLSTAMMQVALIDRTPDSEGEHRSMGFLLARTPGSFLGDLMSESAFGHTGQTGTSIVVAPQAGLWVMLRINQVCPPGPIRSPSACDR